MGKGDNRLTRLVRRRRAQRKKKAKERAVLESVAAQSAKKKA